MSTYYNNYISTFRHLLGFNPLSVFYARNALLRKLRYDMPFREKYQLQEITAGRRKGADTENQLKQKIDEVQKKRFFSPLDIRWADNEPTSKRERVKEYTVHGMSGFRNIVGFVNRDQALETDTFLLFLDHFYHSDLYHRSWYYQKFNDMPVRIKRKLYPHLFRHEQMVDSELYTPLGLGIMKSPKTPYKPQFRPRFRPFARLFSSAASRNMTVFGELPPNVFIEEEKIMTYVGYEKVLGNEAKMENLLARRRKIASIKFHSRLGRERATRCFGLSKIHVFPLRRKARRITAPFRITRNRFKTRREIEEPIYGGVNEIFNLDAQVKLVNREYKGQVLEREEHEDLVRYPSASRVARVNMSSYIQYSWWEPVLWEDNANFVGNDESDIGADEFAMVRGEGAKYFFPKSRDKGMHKKNYVFSSFSKLWQRQKSANFFKQMGVHFNFFKRKLVNLSNGGRLRYAQNVKESSKLTYSQKFLYLLQYSLLWFISRTICSDMQLALSFIKNGLIYINGQQITNPLFIVSRLSVIRFAIPTFLFPFFDLFVWKLIHAKKEISHFKDYFAKFAPPSVIEVSFKTGEMLFLAQALCEKEFRAPMFNLDFSDAALYGQRFFKKQKKFGFGRLI